MFILRISFVLLIITCNWQNGEAVKRDPSKPDDLTHEFNELITVLTEYPNVKDEDYKQLLCTYVFTCQRYMDSIKTLVDEANEFLLKTVLENDIIHPSFFQNQVVNMFYILEHFGTVKSLDPLWHVYVYLECLTTFVSIVYKTNFSQKFIKNNILITRDHGVVYESITRFTTDNNCASDNIAIDHNYNFTDEKARETAMTLFTGIIEEADERNKHTRESLGIENDHVYFFIDDLRLIKILLDDDTMEILLDHFAEATGWPGVYKSIQTNCCENREIVTVLELVADLGKCPAMFLNLVKYIIARNAMKYLLDVHSTLPSSVNGVRPTAEEMTLWISASNIQKTNETMLKYYTSITALIALDKDEELTFFAQLFQSEPQDTFSDPKNTDENVMRISKMLDQFSKGFNYSPPKKMPHSTLDPSYKSRRKETLEHLATLLEVEVSGSDENKYEGMLDLFLFIKFITIQFDDINFEIAFSFLEFSKTIV